ncbi:MAG TPA: tetratricopeptide repeat protein, partial [Nannocystaceae bacterium]|nr:tetratricopeptide repeat protein [Nannocystaceae bacterium]
VVAQAGSNVEGTQSLVRVDAARPPALYRIPFSLAAAGIVLIALQAGKPVIGLALLFTVMFTTASVAWRSFARRHAPALALRAQADKALRSGSYGEARSLYERALALVQRDLPTGSPEVLLNCYSLATVHSMLHDRVRADEYLQRLLRGLEDRVPASWRGQLAWLLRRVAHQHSLAGDHARAIDLCERALELVGPAPGADDTTVRSVVDDVAWIHHHAGQYATAEYMFREALAIHEQFRDAALEVAQRPVRGTSHADSPYRVPGPAVAPTTGGLDRAVAYSLLGLGWTLFERARYDEARACFERARLVANLAGRPTEGRTRGTSLHVEILRGRGAIEVALGHYDEARQLYDDARQLAEGSEGSTQRAALAIDLGWLARCAGHNEEADAAYTSAAAALSGGEESTGTIACALHESLAELRRRQGRLREAAKEIQRAASLAEQCLGPEHPRVASIEAIASRIHTARSDWAEAERCGRRCLAILRAGLGADHPRCAEGWVALGELHLARAQHGAAEHAFSEAMRLREAAFGPAHPELAEVFDGMIAVFRASGRDHDADALNERRGAVVAA